jgi:hypothetical protein
MEHKLETAALPPCYKAIFYICSQSRFTATGDQQATRSFVKLMYFDFNPATAADLSVVVILAI